ncbi:hypothetical protein ABZP36_010609 [Zizania latifolia]
MSAVAGGGGGGGGSSVERRRHPGRCRRPSSDPTRPAPPARRAHGLVGWRAVSQHRHRGAWRRGGTVRAIAAPGLTEADFPSAVESTLFRQRLKNLLAEKGVLAYGKLNLRQILIQPSKCVITIISTGVPEIVLPRGPAVVVLILLESKGQIYAVLTEQVRVSVGKFILELPAGMLDDEKAILLEPQSVSQLWRSEMAKKEARPSAVISIVLSHLHGSSIVLGEPVRAS